MRQSALSGHFLNLEPGQGLLLHDEGGVICDADNVVCELLAVPREKLCETEMAELDLDFPKPFIERLWEAKSATAPAMRYGRLKGGLDSLIPVQIRVFPIRKEGRCFFLLAVRVVSERQRVEAVLATSENQLQAVIDAEPECVKLVSRDGILMEMNPAGLAMVEADSPDQAIGREISELVHEEDRQTFEQANSRAFDGESCVAQFRITGLKGTKRWMETHVSPLRDSGGNVTAALSITRDITERKEVDAIILKLLEGTAGAVGENFFRGLIKAMAEWLNVPFAFVGETLLPRSSEDSSPTRIKTICCFADGQFADNFEYAIQGTPCESVTDGHMCHHETGVARLFPGDAALAEMGADSYLGIPLRSETGAVIGALVAIDRKPMPRRERTRAVFQIFAARASSELNRILTRRHEKELEQQLHQVQRMESIGTLAGGIAHDFNNIVCAIMANAELAMMDLDDKHPAFESVEGIVKSAKRAGSLVSQIMMFSRHKTPVRVPVSLSGTVSEATKMMRSVIPAMVELETVIDPVSHNVLADADQVHQVIVNLCTNAWHAIGLENGKIVVSLRGVEIEEPKSLGARDLRKGAYTLLQVKDNGKGMDPETLGRIYDPFFTTKEAGQGVGLGLSVVHGIVDVHDAQILVESRLGEGTTFSVYFPIINEDESAEPVSAATRLDGNGKRILCIDDEVSILEVTQRILQRQGFEVTAISEPERAIEVFERNPNGFDLVLADYFMPKLTGLDVARRIRSLNQELPIILSSGNISETTRESADQSGVGAILDKPYSSVELSKVLLDVFGRS